MTLATNLQESDLKCIFLGYLPGMLNFNEERELRGKGDLMRLVSSVSPYSKSRTSAYTVQVMDHNTPPCCLGSATFRWGTQVPGLSKGHATNHDFKGFPIYVYFFLKMAQRMQVLLSFLFSHNHLLPLAERKKDYILLGILLWGVKPSPAQRVIGNIQVILRAGITLMNRYQPPFRFMYFPILCFQQN